MQRIDQTIVIQAPVAHCYRMLIHPDTYLASVPELRSIRPRGQDSVWQWELQGPDGSTLYWELELDGVRHQHHIISWHTVRDADIAHSGAITLHAEDDRQTSLRLVVEYKRHAPDAAWSERAIEQGIIRSLKALKRRLEQQPQGKRDETPGMASNAKGPSAPMNTAQPETLNKM